MRVAVSACATERSIAMRLNASMAQARADERELQRNLYAARVWQDRAETYRANVLAQVVPCCIRWPFAASDRVNTIIREVAADHGISPDDVKGVRRNHHLVKARQEAMYRLRHETTMTLPQIGRRLGNRDHTTILHGVRQHQARIDRGEVLS